MKLNIVNQACHMVLNSCSKFYCLEDLVLCIQTKHSKCSNNNCHQKGDDHYIPVLASSTEVEKLWGIPDKNKRQTQQVKWVRPKLKMLGCDSHRRLPASSRSGRPNDAEPLQHKSCAWLFQNLPRLQDSRQTNHLFIFVYCHNTVLSASATCLFSTGRIHAWHAVKEQCPVCNWSTSRRAIIGTLAANRTWFRGLLRGM